MSETQPKEAVLGLISLYMTVTTKPHEGVLFKKGNPDPAVKVCSLLFCSSPLKHSWDLHGFHGVARSRHCPVVIVALIAHSCPTVCHPLDCNPPDSSAHGILQVRILEWVAISFSRLSGVNSWKRKSAGVRSEASLCLLSLLLAEFLQVRSQTHNVQTL